MSPLKRWLWILAVYFLLPCCLGLIGFCIERSFYTGLEWTRYAVLAIVFGGDGLSLATHKKAFHALALPGLIFYSQVIFSWGSKRRINVDQILEEFALAPAQGTDAGSSASAQETGSDYGHSQEVETLILLLRDIYEIIDSSSSSSSWWLARFFKALYRIFLPKGAAGDQGTLELLEQMKDLLENCILCTILCPQAAEQRKVKESYWWVAEAAYRRKFNPILL